MAGESVIDTLEKIQNQALRIVTGAVKTTPIDAMLILTNGRPIRSVIQERALILWERITRVPGYFALWSEVNPDLTRNLKTQAAFLQGVLELRNSLDLNCEPECIVQPQNPVNSNNFQINLDIGQTVTKSTTDSTILKALTLEVIDASYPESDWLRIYTDGSLLSDSPVAGAGVFSEIFSFYFPVGVGSSFDGEIAAIGVALSQLLCHLDKFTRAVVLSDSKAALLAIVSNNTLTQDILDCRNYLKSLESLEKVIVFQWVPAHCGIPGNEMADSLAKKGASIKQKFSRPLPFCTAKSLVKTAIRAQAQKDLSNRTSTKSWGNAIPKLRNGPRQRAVAEFRLATGHDCLRKHLFRINVVDSPICPLCSLGEEMDSAHLLRCPALRKSSLSERYWEARDKIS